MLMPLLAALPLLIVLFLMIGRKWPGSRAGIAGWISAVILAIIPFGGNLTLLLVSFGKASLLAFYVLYIIWMALFLYHTVNEAGVIRAIGDELPHLASDKATQALLLSWIFGSFIQGASGFGVPAAIVGPLLLGLGFAPSAAVVVALMGHAWAVTFGSLGTSYFSLLATTGVSGESIAWETAVMITICCFGCGISVLWASGGWNALKKRGLIMLFWGTCMAGAQYAIITLGLWNLAAMGAALFGLIVAFITLRFNNPDRKITPKLRQGFFPYLILIVIVLLGTLVFKEALGLVKLSYLFPETTTALGWQTASATGRSINLFGHPGALLLYSSLLIFGWFRYRGTLNNNQAYSLRPILHKTIKGSIKSTISILTLVAMAVTMQHAGMTQELAEVLSENTGSAFPFFSPFVGALGAVMTGSNTNSNVVFGVLQQQTALALNLSVPWILAAQTAGGALGSVFAPAKVVVGASTVAGADDGVVLRKTAVYSLIIIAMLGAVAMILA